jgi:spore germination cell wall hydrolase CwlJ-like protein
MEALIARLNRLDELDLMTALAMGEAEAEVLVGKIGVCWTVRNRREDKKSRWPTTFNAVMLQKGQFDCFKERFFREKILTHNWQNIYWKESRLAAWAVLYDYTRDPTGGANLYWNPDICKPDWDWSKVTLLKQIGNHQFARE